MKVIGTKSEKRIQHYLWNVMAHHECYKKYGGTATAVQTGLPPAIAVIMRAKKEITMNGVYPPEALDPLPIIKRLEEFGFMTSEEKREVVVPERRLTA